MDGGSIRKLTLFLGHQQAATALVAGGYNTPRRVKDATDEELLALRGIGEATLAIIRVKCPEN